MAPSIPRCFPATARGRSRRKSASGQPLAESSDGFRVGTTVGRTAPRRSEAGSWLSVTGPIAPHHRGISGFEDGLGVMSWEVRSATQSARHCPPRTRVEEAEVRANRSDPDPTRGHDIARRPVVDPSPRGDYHLVGIRVEPRRPPRERARRDDLVPARRLREQVLRRRPRYPAGYRRERGNHASTSSRSHAGVSRSRSHSRWYASM